MISKKSCKTENSNHLKAEVAILGKALVHTANNMVFLTKLHLFDGSMLAADIFDEAVQCFLTLVSVIARYHAPAWEITTTKQLMENVGFYYHHQQHRKEATVSSQIAASLASP